MRARVPVVPGIRSVGRRKKFLILSLPGLGTGRLRAMRATVRCRARARWRRGPGPAA
jgi:hypothetical protein